MVNIPGDLLKLLERGTARKSEGSRNGVIRHSTISSRVSPFTAFTAVERLAGEQKSADLPRRLFPRLQIDPLGRGRIAAQSQRSFAMTSRMPEISVSLLRTSGIERSKC